MRTVFIVLGFGLIALVIGFAPRPLILPDWQTPYDKALTEGDCEAVSRIIQILRVTDFWQEAGEAEFQNSRLDRCDAEPVPEYSRNRLNIFVTDSEGYVSRGYIEERWSTSFLGSRIYYSRAWRSKLKTSEIVSAANQELRSVLRQCMDQYGSVTGGLPNYNLLNYAMKSPDISSEKISKIAREQKAQCVRNILAAVAVMNVAADTPEDRALITTYNFIILMNKETAPDQEWLYGKIFSGLSEADYQLANPGLTVTEAQEPSDYIYSCHNDQLADQLLSSAIFCAYVARLFIRESTLDNTPSAPPLTAEYAVFYAKRAKRLGWRDVGAAEDAAKTLLTGDCYDAIVALEAKEADEKTDVRDYEDLDWPIGPGEACALEAKVVE